MKTPVPPDFDSPESAVPPDCAESRAALQRRLDGDTNPESDTVRRHREQCSDCRAYADAASMLLAGLTTLPKADAPAAFADRVVTRALTEPYRPWFKRRLTWAGVFALAASVLIAVLAIVRETRTVDFSGAMVSIVPPRVEPPPVVPDKPVPLRDSLQEAGSAVSALTRKATIDGFGLKLPKWPMPKTKVDPPVNVDPGLASLQEVRHNAALCIAPITDSAKRAFGVFWRELGPDTKPVNN